MKNPVEYNIQGGSPLAGCYACGKIVCNLAQIPASASHQNWREHGRCPLISENKTLAAGPRCIVAICN